MFLHLTLVALSCFHTKSTAVAMAPHQPRQARKIKYVFYLSCISHVIKGSRLNMLERNAPLHSALRSASRLLLRHVFTTCVSRARHVTSHGWVTCSRRHALSCYWLPSTQSRPRICLFAPHVITTFKLTCNQFSHSVSCSSF